jgi:hypothetical protein
MSAPWTARGPQARLQAQTFGRLPLPRLRAERHAADHAPTQCGQFCLGFRLSHPLLPRLWFRDRARLQRRAWEPKRHPAQAAPTPSPRTSRQLRAQRVVLHIAHHFGAWSGSQTGASHLLAATSHLLRQVRAGEQWTRERGSEPRDNPSGVLLRGSFFPFFTFFLFFLSI